MRQPSRPRRRFRERKGCVISAAIAGALFLGVVAFVGLAIIGIYNEDDDFVAVASVTDPQTDGDGAGRVKITVDGETVTSGEEGFESITGPYRKSGLSVEVGQRVVVAVAAPGHQADCNIEKNNFIGGDSSLSISPGFQRQGGEDSGYATCTWTRGPND